MKPAIVTHPIATAHLAGWLRHGFPPLPPTDRQGQPWDRLPEEACSFCDDSHWAEEPPLPKKIDDYIHERLERGNTYEWIASAINGKKTLLQLMPRDARGVRLEVSAQYVRRALQKRRKGLVPCPQCTPKPLELAEVLGVLVPRADLLNAIEAPLPDLIRVGVDEGLLCLPRHAPIEGFVPTSKDNDIFEIVTTRHYPHEQLPLRGLARSRIDNVSTATRAA